MTLWNHRLNLLVECIQYFKEITWHCVYPRPARVSPASCVHCARVRPAFGPHDARVLRPRCPRSASTLPAGSLRLASNETASCWMQSSYHTRETEEHRGNPIYAYIIFVRHPLLFFENFIAN